MTLLPIDLGFATRPDFGLDQTLGLNEAIVALLLHRGTCSLAHNCGSGSIFQRGRFQSLEDKFTISIGTEFDQSHLGRNTFVTLATVHVIKISTTTIIFLREICCRAGWASQRAFDS